ncbi:VanZ family protein [Tuberibacillus sp. Marseille-P3662]|uniref:VanZ family protein n=1 Tax=Tuberibacillus sp. Marseille-P3662 TaxID=1965358 RepID=UPI0020CB2EF3|nr:VanZ family protein [Tuberibacillus sp. Marseille-P3662]
MMFIWFQSSHAIPQQLLDIHLFAFNISLAQTAMASTNGAADPNMDINFGLVLEAAHLMEFAILYALLIIASSTLGPLTFRKEFVAIMIAILYAFMDEIHQSFVPGRSISSVNLIKDYIGIFVAWLLIRQKFTHRKNQNRNRKMGKNLS